MTLYETEQGREGQKERALLLLNYYRQYTDIGQQTVPRGASQKVKQKSLHIRMNFFSHQATLVLFLSLCRRALASSVTSIYLGLGEVESKLQPLPATVTGNISVFASLERNDALPPSIYSDSCMGAFTAAFPILAFLMGRLLISRADYRATSARRHTTAHPTVVRRFLCSGYVLSKKISCVLMNMILVTII
jgi:hypothetical protein